MLVVRYNVAKMKRPQTWREKLKSPVVIVWAVSIIILLATLVLVHLIRPYNSDDVSWQNILFTWQPFNGHQVALGSSDNFVNKIPFFALFDQLFTAGRKTLLLQSSVLAVAGFTSFYIACTYFLRKAKVTLNYTTLLPFVWLSSFGYSFAQLYLLPIWRGFEAGLSFLIFMLVAMVFYGEVSPLKTIKSKLLTLLAAATCGLLIYSDPFFLYFTFGPIALFTLVLLLFKKIQKSQAFVMYGVLALAVVFAKITDIVTIKAGVKMVASYPLQFISFDKLLSNIELTIQSILTIFGANFFGQAVVSLLAISAGINAILLGYLSYKAFILTRNSWRLRQKISLSQWWLLFFGALFLIIPVIYGISTVAVDLNTYRYFIIFTLISTLLLSFTLTTQQKQVRLATTVLLVAAIVLNIGVSIRGIPGYLQPGAQGNERNKVNFALIDAVRNKGLIKGYGNYWQANINTYLTGGKVQFLPVLCGNGHTGQFRWLIDQENFTKPADKTFYIVDPDLHEPPTCTSQQVAQQFGTPQEVIQVGNKTIYIYDYDISSRM